MIRLLASAMARLAALLLPPPLADWGWAMTAETREIDDPRAALRFALGCLAGALREVVTVHPAPETAGSPAQEIKIMSQPGLLDRPRVLAACFAIAACGCGFAYLAIAGAPARYLVMNGGALALGLSLLAAFALTPRFAPGPALAGLLLAAGLLLTSLFGVSADGVTRWISIGGLALQPGLILVPLLVLAFARAPGGLAMFAIWLAALALALQPDRAMAGALAAGLGVLAIAQPSRLALTALAAALAGFAVTLLRADPSPAMPFVDQIYFSAFPAHPLAGAAVFAGTLLMLAPALLGALRDTQHRALHLAFGAVWLAIAAAAALGNYPTPLVGYGASAILGYLLSLLALPPVAGSPSDAGRRLRTPPDPADPSASLRALASA